jgi:hypothetical protein
MLVECDDPLAVHQVCSTWPAFEFQARPVIAIKDSKMLSGLNAKRLPFATD